MATWLLFDAQQLEAMWLLFDAQQLVAIWFYLMPIPWGYMWLLSASQQIKAIWLIFAAQLLGEMCCCYKLPNNLGLHGLSLDSI
jgi:hypothetical protein